MIKFELLKRLAERTKELKEGQGLVEYALILFLVAVVVIAILILVGPQIGSVFSAATPPPPETNLQTTQAVAKPGQSQLPRRH